MMRRWTDYVWPTLEPQKAEAREQAQSALAEDLKDIEDCSFSSANELVLSAAKQMAEDEDARRRGAEARASTYLLVIAALIPLLTYLEGTVWGQTFGQAPRGMSLTFLGVAVLYLLGAGRWAFWTLRVASYDRVDGSDLVAISKQARPAFAEALAKKILAANRRNRDAINAKITGIKMCHLFLKLAIRWFGFLLLLQIFWYLGGLIVPQHIFSTGGKI